MIGRIKLIRKLGKVRLNVICYENNSASYDILDDKGLHAYIQALEFFRRDYPIVYWLLRRIKII